MTAREWSVGDRALLPVVVDGVDVGMDRVIRVALTCTPYTVDIDPEDLLSDDRRPSWLPGQPGDITEVEPDGMRVMRDANGRWYGLSDGERVWRSDDEVPVGARLLLPARTREKPSRGFADVFGTGVSQP